MSDYFGSFDTHIAILYVILCRMAFVIKCHEMEFYDILLHVPYDIKCHKVWQYGYQMNRFNQTNWCMEFKSANIPKNWNTKNFLYGEWFLSPKLSLPDRYGSFDTHIDILYDILCHMAYVIKCHKMTFYGILWHMQYDIKGHGLWQYGYQKNRIYQANWFM